MISHNELVIYYFYPRPLFHLRQTAVCVQSLVCFFLMHGWYCHQRTSQPDNSLDGGEVINRTEPCGTSDNSSKNSKVPSSLFID